MAGEIGQAFVRLRPNTAGFKSETESGLKRELSGIGKLAAGAFAVGGTVETLKGIFEAASKDQAAFEVMDRVIRNAGLSTDFYGKSIDSLVKKQAILKGFTDESLAGSFLRLVQATKNTGTAFRDLGVAEDLARARHIDVEQAAIAVAKGEQGVTTALQRLGVVVRPVTAAQDALKRSHTEAAAAGAKFSKADNEIYKQSLLTAKAQDAAASRIQVISTLQQRFGGAAATFATGASGAWARLHEQVHLFEVFLGEQVLPGVARVLTRVGDEFQKLSKNEHLRDNITGFLNDVKSAANAVGPPLMSVAHAFQEVEHTVGSTAIIAAAVAYKSFSVAVSLAAAAGRRWAALKAEAAGTSAADAAATSVDAAAQTALSRAVLASTAAMIANTEAIAANGAVSGAAVVETEALTAAKAALAAATGVSAAAGTAEVGVMGILRTGLLGLVGGPIGAVTLGVAALAGGIAYLATRQTSWDRANERTTQTLNSLGDAIQRAHDLQGAAGQARSSITDDKLGIRRAALGVSEARQTLSSGAGPGTLEHEQNVLGLAEATQQYRSALAQLRSDEGRAANIATQHDAAVVKIRENLRGAVNDVSDLASKYRDALNLQIHDATSSMGTYSQKVERVKTIQRDAATTASSLATALEKQAASLAHNQPLIAGNTLLLAEFVQKMGRLPTAHETKLILNNRDASATLADMLDRVLPAAFLAATSLAAKGGAAAGSAFWAGLGTSLGGGSGSNLFAGAVGTLIAGAKAAAAKATKANHDAAVSTAKDAARVAAEAAKEDAATLKAARDNLTDIASASQDAIQSAAYSLQNAQENLASVIKNGKTQITDAVNSAKQSLSSIGQSLASDIDAYLNKKPLGDSLSKTSAEQFRKLAALIRSGGATPDLLRQYQALSSQLQTQAAAKNLPGSASKLTTAQQIADLTNNFNKGKQDAAALERLTNGIAKILHTDKITKAAVAKVLGTAAADHLFNQIGAIRQQARAEQAGPRRRGLSGDEPSIVRPHDTVIQVQKDIARATRDVGKAQLAESRTQTTELKKISKATADLASKQKGADWTATLAARAAARAKKVSGGSGAGVKVKSGG